MCSERDSPLEPFVLLAPGQPELARLICGAHLGPPVLTRKQKRPRVNSLVCDRVAAFSVAGPPEVLSRMSRPVTQAAERERELARACSQRLKQAAPSLPGESVSCGFADRGALEGYPSHYTSLVSDYAAPRLSKHPCRLSAWFPQKSLLWNAFADHHPWPCHHPKQTLPGRCCWTWHGHGLGQGRGGRGGRAGADGEGGTLGPSPPEVHQSTGHSTTASCLICQEYPIQKHR